jgi:teichoic acid transport system permease protein
MFSIQALTLTVGGTLRHHPGLSRVLQINPAAVYISLVRNALLKTQRISAPGSKPYDAARCSLYSRSTKAVTDSAYCHASAVVSQGELWLWGVGWALAALVIGFFVFWQAEARYGRG